MMRTTAIAGLVAMLLLALMTGAVVEPQTRAQIAANSAVVTAMHGDVRVRRGTSWRNATVNATLKSGDAIRTGKGARAELTVHGSGYVRLEENTHLLIAHLDEKGGTTLKALIGGVWVSIERALVGAGGFKIEMPSAVAAVKGTVFRCLVDRGQSSETFVYDGEVFCEADGRGFSVTPARCFAKRRAVAAMVRDMDLDEDAVREWVTWNRRKDLINSLGNPRVVLAVAEHNGDGRRVDAQAQRRLAEKLRRAGFNVEVLPANRVPDRPIEFALRPDTGSGATGAGGTSAWNGDLVIAAEFFASSPHEVGVLQGDAGGRGRGKADAFRKTPGGVWGSRANGRASIIDPRTGQSTYEWDARGAGQGRSGLLAGDDAVVSVSERFGDEAVSELIAAMMGQKEMVRVHLRGVASRREMSAFMQRLRTNPRVRRVFPHKFVPGAAVLGIATDLRSEELARWVKENCAGAVRVTGCQGAIIGAEIVARAQSTK